MCERHCVLVLRLLVYTRVFISVTLYDGLKTSMIRTGKKKNIIHSIGSISVKSRTTPEQGK